MAADKRRRILRFFGPRGDLLAAEPPALTVYDASGQVRVRTELDDGTFEITVRSPASDDGRCGASATMPISAFDLRRLVREMAEDLL